MTCPICGKAPEAKYRPFCSRRCADIDLGRWLTESYRVPAEDSGEETGPAEDGTLERAQDAAPVPRPKRPQ